LNYSQFGLAPHKGVSRAAGCTSSDLTYVPFVDGLLINHTSV